MSSGYWPAKIIMSNPAKFGYVLTPEDLYWPAKVATVEITAINPVPVHVIAQAANTYFKVIKDLNPQIKLYHLPAGTYRLSVPSDAASGFSERFDKFLKEWNTQKKEHVYTVKKGDSLAKIAGRFNVPMRALAVWNRIANGKKVAPGDKLYIFTNDFKTINEAMKQEKSGKPEKSDPSEKQEPTGEPESSSD